MILALVLLAAVTVFYVSNTIAVDRLSAEINSLQSAYGEIRNMNIILNKEIDRKKSMERITAIARNRLGMVMPKEVPVWFDLDETRLRSADK
jgi:cell division protein FtsB